MADFRAIADAVKAGRAKVVKTLVNEALAEGANPEALLNEGLVVGMNELGIMFKNNEVYVPEVLIAARAMKAGTEILKPLLAAANVQSLGKVAIGTVKGDLHDIGKNLVRIMLETGGFDVYDLGRDVALDTFVDYVRDNDVDILCMSSLMTTTMPGMGKVIEKLKKADLRDKVKIMVGGAPVSPAFAEKIGADGYTRNAIEAVEFAKKLVGAA